MKLIIYSKQKLADTFYTIYEYFEENGYILWGGELITEYTRLKEKLNNVLNKRISTNGKNVIITPRITIEEIDQIIDTDE